MARKSSSGVGDLGKLATELAESATIRKIDVASLKVDPSYQREPNQALVDNIADNWDAVSSELILVSDRGEDKNWVGQFYIVNGQHRTLAARKLNIKKLDARIIDLTWADDPGLIEAVYRLKTNVRQGDRPLERFKAQVRAANPESLAIVRILDRFDTEVNESPSNEVGINPIAAVEKIYRVDNGKLLTETLQIIKEVYGNVGGSNVTQASLSALAWFIARHADESDRDRLVEKLTQQGRAAWDRKARTIASISGGSLWINYYKALVEIYNERLTSKQLDFRTKGSLSFGSMSRQKKAFTSN